MQLDDVRGAQLAMAYLEALTSSPGGRAAFLTWASGEAPDVWEQWAQSKGRSPDDPILAQDAVLAAQAAIIEGGRLLLDQLAAQVEAQQLLDQGPGPGR